MHSADHNDRPMRLDRSIARLALPAVVSNVTVPLLGLSDTAISGHLGEAACLGAIAIGSMMINVITWLCGFLRMGTTGLTARAYGEADTDAQWRTLVRGLAIAAVIGVLAIAVQTPVCSLFLMWSDASEGVAAYARLYYALSVWGLPAVLGVMAVNGWFIGMQNTVWPMAVAITTNALNIALSLVFVLVCGLWFAGVALGTLCANWFGLALALWAVWHKMRGKSMPPLRRLLGRGGWRQYFGVNSTLFLRSACVMTVSVAMTSIGSRLGDNVLAANAVMMQFFLFFSFVMDGLAYAGEALAGRYSGANDRPMLLATIRRLLMWSAVMAVAFSAVYAVWGVDIMGLLTDLPEVVATARGYRVWLVALPLLTVAAFIFDGFYIGLLHIRQMLWATLAGMCLFGLIAGVHFADGALIIGLPTNGTLWTAFLAWLVARGATLALLLPGVLRDNRQPG